MYCCCPNILKKGTWQSKVREPNTLHESGLRAVHLLFGIESVLNGQLRRKRRNSSTSLRLYRIRRPTLIHFSSGYRFVQRQILSVSEFFNLRMSLTSCGVSRSDADFFSLGAMDSEFSTEFAFLSDSEFILSFMVIAG